MRLDFPEEFPFFQMGMPPRLVPMLPVTLVGLKGLRVETYALLDSGADASLFHARWADKIGLDLYAGRFEELFGIDPGSPIQCFYHRVDVTVGLNSFSCDIAFSEDIGDDISDNLLGREVLFDRFQFAFRQRIGTLYVGKDV